MYSDQDVFNWDGAIELFEELSLKEELLRGIYSYGFKKPSAIQQKEIRSIIIGHDTIAQARSGTGKTAAIAISVLQSIDTSINRCQALILAPTRELARAIARLVSQLGEFMNVRCYALYGGPAFRDDISTLERGVQVVVGTPNRDMLIRKHLKTNSLKLLILEEADDIMSWSFKDDIKKTMEEFLLTNLPLTDPFSGLANVFRIRQSSKSAWITQFVELCGSYRKETT